MTLEDLQAYCMSKPGVTEELPFGPTTLVYKVGGKMFALCGLDKFEYINLKHREEEIPELRANHPEIQPGYHMSKKHWNSVYVNQGLSDQEIYDLVDVSYQLILNSLPKKKQAELED